MLRQTPETYISTSIVRTKDTQGEMERVFLRRQRNGQFTDVFNKHEHTQIPLLERSAPFMDDIVVSKDGVTKLLKGLNLFKA